MENQALLMGFFFQIIVTGGNLEQSSEALALAKSHGKINDARLYIALVFTLVFNY